MTPSCVSFIFVMFSITFLILGALILDASGRTVEQSKRYDNQCTDGEFCFINLKIEEDMDAPVYFYYKLVNFYQNHRSYVMDYDIQQLRGDVDDTSSCTFDDTKTRDGKTVYPCGLIANSFFNDIFNATVVRGSGDVVDLKGNDWDGSDISWESDRNQKFKNASDPIDPSEISRIGTQGNTLPLPTDQDFQVWFRVAGLPRFNKLYRKIGETSLKKGDTLKIGIMNNFKVGGFGGEKHIYISTTTWLGGSNYFLGSCYIIVGIMCALYATVMLLKRCLDPRPLGQMKYYAWTGLGATNPDG